MAKKKHGEPTVHLYLPVSLNTEVELDGRPHVAHLELTAKEIERLISDIVAVQRIKASDWDSICNVDVFVFNVEWGLQLITDGREKAYRNLLDKLDVEDYPDLPVVTNEPVPMDFDEDSTSCRVEMVQKRIYEDRVLWTAILKHTDVEISTESIRIEDLKTILGLLANYPAT